MYRYYVKIIFFQHYSDRILMVQQIQKEDEFKTYEDLQLWILESLSITFTLNLIKYIIS